MNNNQTPLAQDKWIATGLWVVLLIVMILSTNGTLVGVSYTTSFTGVFSNAQIRPPFWQPITTGIVAFIVFFLVLRAWGLFFAFSRRLFIALGKQMQGSETGSVFYPFLSFSREKANAANGEPQAEEATGSIVSSLIKTIGLAYLFAFIGIMIAILATMFARR